MPEQLAGAGENPNSSMPSGPAAISSDEDGGYPFVTHAFGDMGNGALGVIRTENAPKPKPGSGH